MEVKLPERTTDWQTDKPTADRVLDHNFLTKTKTFSYCFYSKREKTTNETFWYVYLVLILGSSTDFMNEHTTILCGIIKENIIQFWT